MPSGCLPGKLEAGVRLSGLRLRSGRPPRRRSVDPSEHLAQYRAINCACHGLGFNSEALQLSRGRRVVHALRAAAGHAIAHGEGGVRAAQEVLEHSNTSTTELYLELEISRSSRIAAKTLAGRWG